MIIVCPHCGILYGVEPGDLAAESRTVRCSNCDWQWLHTEASALPNNDAALRLLAASLGRGGSRSKAARVAPSPVETASPRQRPAPQEMRPPGRAAGAAEREAVLRPAPVTTLYQSGRPLPVAPAEVTARPAKLSSRQLDALFEPADADVADVAGAASLGDADAAGAEPRPDGERSTADARGWKSSPSPLAPAGGDTAANVGPAVEAARALGAVAEKAELWSAPAPGSDDEGQMEAPAPPAERTPLLRRAPAPVLAAGAIAATLLVSFGLLAGTRGLVLGAFPGAAGFYAAIGLAPADTFAEGLEIRSVSSTRSWSDGEQVLTVAGNLANVAEQPRSLPMVRVVLVDGSDAEVQEVVVVPPGETLPVGESIRFEARISNPADTAERIKVSLTPRPEPS